MKSKYFILVFSLSFLFACNKDNDLFEIMQESDLAALEGMDEAYDNALVYNDSLQLCFDDPISCDSVTVAHFDGYFHQFDDMFNLHHENYSHNYIDDDHHHEGGHNVRHGSMGEHQEEDEHGEEEEGEEEHEYEHNLETLEMMMELREMHEAIHPG